MPNVKDSPVVLIGQVIAVDDVVDFESKNVLGVKVTILSGDGLAIVKQKNEQRFGDSLAVPGDEVAWYVRQSPYSVDGNSGMSVAFVRTVTLGDIDRIHTIVSSKTTVPASK